MSAITEFSEFVNSPLGKKFRIIFFAFQLLTVILITNKFMNLLGYYYNPQEITLNCCISFVFSKEFLIVFFIFGLNCIAMFMAAYFIRFFAKKAGANIVFKKDIFPLMKFWTITGIISMNDKQEYIWGKNYANSMKQREIIDEMGKGLYTIYSIALSILVFLIFATFMVDIQYHWFIVIILIIILIGITAFCFLNFMHYFVIEFGQRKLNVMKDIIEKQKV